MLIDCGDSGFFCANSHSGTQIIAYNFPVAYIPGESGVLLQKLKIKTPKLKHLDAFVFQYYLNHLRRVPANNKRRCKQLSTAPLLFINHDNTSFLLVKYIFSLWLDC